MACITTGRCKLVPWQRSALAQDCQRSNSSWDTSQFVPCNKRAPERGNPNKRGWLLRRVCPFINCPVEEQRQTPRPPATSDPAPPIYPTIIFPPHEETAPSYHIYPPALVILSLPENYQDASLPPTPFVHPTPLESIISGGSELIGRTFQSFLPEHKYLATIVPTQSKKELNTFRSYCWYLLQGWWERHIEHLLSELTNLTPDPIVFTGYLWKYHTSVNNNSIVEDYRIINRTDSHPQTAQLNRAYTVFYGWHDNSYTISLAWPFGIQSTTNIPLNSTPLQKKSKLSQ